MALLSNTDAQEPTSRWMAVEEIAGRTLMLLWLFCVVNLQITTLTHIIDVGAGTAMMMAAFAKCAVLLVFSLMAAGFTLLRRPAKAVASGIEPRVSALLGTYLMLAIPMMPSADIPEVWTYFGTVLMIVGLMAAVSCLSWLGRSYSIMASARKLVTAGPYGIVRHPLYACEILLMTGLMIVNFSLWAVVVEVVSILFLWRRMINEERVLTEAFPEYVEYAKLVPRVIPRLGRQLGEEIALNG